MSDTQSTYKVTLKELIDVSNWLTVKINLSPTVDDVTPMNNKINLLVPIAEKFCNNLNKQTDMIMVEEDLLLALGNSASNLWNAAVLNSRGNSVSRELKQLLVDIKYFASLLFLIFATLEKTNSESLIRAFSCFNITLRHCLDLGLESTKDTSSIGKISVKCEQECDKLLQKMTINNSHHPAFNDLKNDYFVTCFQLALQQCDLTAAKIYWTKIAQTSTSHQANTGNSLSLGKIPSKYLIDLTRVIHNSCMKQTNKNMSECVDLLRSSITSLQSCKEQRVTLDPAYRQIKLSTTLLLTQCLLETKDFEACEKYTHLALAEFPEEPNVYKACIEMVKKKHASNNDLLTEAYTDIFLKMLFGLPLQQNMKEFIGCINDLSKISITAGLSCSDHLFSSEKLNLENDAKNLEQLFVNKIYNITQSIILTELEKIDALTSAFDLATKTFTSPITSESTQSLSSLLWTTGRKMSKAGHHQNSISCFKLCFHFLIESQINNKAVIIREIQKNYLHLKEYEIVQSLYEELSEIDKYDSKSQRILFIALANKSVQTDGTTIEKCMECLENIKSAEPSKFFKYLLSCLTGIEDNDELSLKLFVKIFEETSECLLTNPEVTDVVNFFTACRVALQLFLKLLEKAESFKADITQHYTVIMQILNHALGYVQRSRTLKGMNISIESKNYKMAYSYDELEWFAAVAYNLQCKCYNNKVFIENVLFGEISLDFIDLFKNGVSKLKVTDIEYRKVKCVAIMVFYKIEGGFLKAAETKNYVECLNATLLDLQKGIETLLDDAELTKLKTACHDVLLCLFYIHGLSRDQNSLLSLVNMPLVLKCFSETKLLDGFVSILFAIDKLSNDFKKMVLYAVIEKSMVHFHDNLKLAELIRRLFSLQSSAVTSEQRLKLCKTFLQKIKTDVDNGFYINAQYEIDWLSTHCWNTCVGLVINGEQDYASQWFDTASNLAGLMPHDPEFQTHLKSQKLGELWSQLVGELFSNESSF
ncbi:hypothetical protein ACO0QE_004324 [Hanseniaspora vineae]